MYKPKSSSKGKSSARWGEWSEWTWEDKQGFWYRVRQDADGVLDYDYENTSRSSASKERTPKYSDPVDEITAGVSNLSPSSGTYDTEYQVSSGSGSGSRDKSRTSRGKERRTEYDVDDSENVIRGSRSSRDHRRQTVEEEADNTQYEYTPAAQSGYSTSGPYYQDAYQRRSPDPSLQPSMADYDYNPYDTTSGGSAYEYDTTGYGAGSSGRAANYEPADDGGRTTPRASHRSQIPQLPHITAETSEALDPRYRVERSDRFQPGEIFKASWAEPKGAVNEAPQSVSDQKEIQDHFGVTFYTGFRRFIVIANDQGHCTCVPILTYGGKACTKKGVKPEKHGIIYQRGQRAKPHDREPKLGFPPVKVDITTEGEKLSRESRVNYSKLVTVEHNVKVMFIGTIASSDWPIVPDAINACWAQKTHHKKKSMFK